MPHTPAAPTGTPIDFNPTERDEFYAAPADPGTLTEDDLIPLTSGGDGFAPSRSVSRQTLHNGGDIVTPGSLQGGDTSIDVYLAPRSEKMTMFRSSLRNRTPIIWNRFYRDGTGYAGYAYVTGIVPTEDPEAVFAQTINVSTYNVNDIDAPEPAAT